MAAKDIILENRALMRPVTICDLYNSLATAIDTLDAVTDRVADQQGKKRIEIARCVGPACPDPEQEAKKCVLPALTAADALGVLGDWFRDCLDMVGQIPAGTEIKPPRRGRRR
jgi:hypothetical protein